MRKNIYLRVVAVALTLIIISVILNYYGKTTETFKVIKTFLNI